ncbi:CYTH domain-containing protein [Lapidilactobacillus luobeiensis]|uniref:CYTH domain-containing protein n=1 Tax=Lapidilactobacillus luobeiensis TaxID=2950371 RepID=UPI0028524E2B|nr:CYTH domain-containing protein [Lapidilactobacillus luobeiensis]
MFMPFFIGSFPQVYLIQLQSKKCYNVLLDKEAIPIAALEIEFKNLVTAAEYQRLVAAYPFAPAFSQKNYYFDTADQQLRQQHCGLRIRIFARSAEQTLKVPATIKTAAGHELVEITDPLPLAMAESLVHQQKIKVASQVSAALSQRQIDPAQLHCFAQGTTQRRIATLAAGLLTLDQTDYPNGQTDYELELETKHVAQATTFYQDLLTRFQIPQRPVVNKVMRAISQL